ncbi:hypothetical protein [Flavivirga spongiicola]|uniref:Cadherin-like beta sandwich domain-containing protein n=1 Tax=Flavivirga spongiicola TaxID=421621 RepID=A0ABU7XZ83_9FLAO|nr:hypothetical protein [Flavivirga sp. MEBiC05379]MDO5981097.1 hypothetical protein [Flavivirga sp. MEBiC05379]
MKKLFKASVFLLIILLIGCSSDDDNTPSIPVQVDLTAAKLNDFQFSEVTYTNIEMRQPEIVEGKEKTSGQITVTIPATADNLSLSLASVNFDESKFTISPEVGAIQSFEGGTVIVYTITSKENPEQSIRYLVSVMKENVQPEEKFEITGFRFEQSKNQTLSSTVEAVKIVEYPGINWNAIFILVPVGTDLTNLIPSIDFEGGSLEYKQGSGSFTAYPTTDLNVDFTSDYDYLSFRDKNEFVLSINSQDLQKNYRVIVDVETPIVLNKNSVTTTDVEEGDTRNFLLKWVNKGNHPIERNLKASNYIDKTSDNKGNIFASFLEVSDPLQGAYIKPGEEGNALVKVNANGVAIGSYDVDIVFSPKYDVNRARINDIIDDLNPIEDIFRALTLNVKTTVIAKNN